MDDDEPQVLRILGLVGSLGFMAAACICGGVLAGCYVDSVLGSSPLWLLVGTLGGIGGSFALTYRWIMRHVR